MTRFPSGSDGARAGGRSPARGLGPLALAAVAAGSLFWLVRRDGPPPAPAPAASQPTRPALAPRARTLPPPAPIAGTARAAPPPVGGDASFDDLHGLVVAFLGGSEFDVPDDADADAEDQALRRGFEERSREFSALEQELAVIAKSDSPRAASAWTDIAAIRLALAEDLLASPRSLR